MTTENIEIRRLHTLEEYLTCQELQVRIWNFSPSEAVPYHQLLITQLNGGLVLGAFHSSVMIGFLYGVQGRKGNVLYHYSHMMGLLPDYRGRGTGERLKLAQRDFTIDVGQKLVLWTYDPLETPNARLNICKLGGLVRHYYVNFYGEFEPGLCASLPTDRFLVEWYVESDRVRGCLEKRNRDIDVGGIKEITATEGNKLVEVDLDAEEDTLLAEVPWDIQRIKAENITLASDWRLKLRSLFITYFGREYVVSDFVSAFDGGVRRNYYVLRKREAMNIVFDP